MKVGWRDSGGKGLSRASNHSTLRDGLLVTHCKVTAMSPGSTAISGGMMDTDGAASDNILMLWLLISRVV